MTPADQAELDVLLHALATDFDEHRKRCRACSPEPCPELEAWLEHKADCPSCRGDAPLVVFRAVGTVQERMRPRPPCEHKHRLLEHNRTCPKCSGPCPHLQRAIAEVCDWRETRLLLTRAQELRRRQDAVDRVDPEPVVPKVAA